MSTRWRATGWVVSFLLVLSLAAVSCAGTATGKVDPSLALWLETGELTPRGEAGSLQVVASPTGEVRVKVLASAPGGAGRMLGGVPVQYSTGTVGSLVVTRAELAQLAADERVSHVEPSWRTRPTLDASVPAVRADWAHAASPAVTGQGVIIGLVDTGIDFRHLDFRYDADRDGTEESTRILVLSDQTWGLFGVTYDRDDIEEDLANGAPPSTGIVKQVDLDGHGTHVASIAAGDGSSSSAGFVGVAPEAWIVAVKTTFYTADILEGVGFVFDEADRRGLPAVVNLSLGGQEGPHDGTSAFERGLDELAQGAGRAIVVSAGNEGDLELHVSSTLQGGARSFDLEAGAREVTMEIWYPGSSRFTVSVASPSGASALAAAGAGSGFVVTGDGTMYIDNSSGGPNANNGDRKVLIRVTNTTSGTRWRVTVRDTEGGGRFDAWVTSSTGRIVDGDSSSTIDEPGNARGVITVGAFDTKATWPSLLGEQDESDEVQPGRLAAFSSQGPTRDGRVKPDLTAPGAWICAALSSSAVAFDDLIHPDGVHAMERGTSMAAPHVAGAIALLFDLDPTLTSAEVREVLTSAAGRDAQTGTVPSVRWGYGKLDVWTAIISVEISEPPEPSGRRPTIVVAENPAIDQAAFTYALPQGTTAAALRVYDIAGRLVLGVRLSVTASDYIWDLASEAGDRAAAGLYVFVVASDRGNSVVGRLVIAP